MIPKTITILFVLMLAATACRAAPTAAGQPEVTTVSATATPTLAPEPTPIPRTVTGWAVETVVEDLEIPWSIVFTSPARMLVSERAGKIREVVDGQLNPEALYVFPDIASQEEAGLMGMALDPDYADNSYIYACYSLRSGDGLIDRVVRLLDQEDNLSMDATILDDIPAAQYHAGCRLGFGPDGKLYITTGDALQPQAAQDTNSLAGKILRINPDGSIPADNPIVDSAVYSYGHRNPQGLAWQPGTGLLYATEHGPSGFDGPEGGDEINLIRAGVNYGWPLVSHDEVLEGTESPLRQFTPAVAPAAAMFYEADVLPMFTGNLFFGALRGEGLARVVISDSDPAVIQSIEWPVTDVGRVREVVEGPDGFIYFSTSNRDGRGEVQAGDDKIFRIVPLYD